MKPKFKLGDEVYTLDDAHNIHTTKNQRNIIISTVTAIFIHRDPYERFSNPEDSIQYKLSGSSFYTTEKDIRYLKNLKL